MFAWPRSTPLAATAAQPQIRKRIGDALPGAAIAARAVVALIDLLADGRDPDAALRLRNFQRTPNLNPAVRQRAEWAISKLQWFPWKRGKISGIRGQLRASQELTCGSGFDLKLFSKAAGLRGLRPALQSVAVRI